MCFWIKKTRWLLRPYIFGSWNPQERERRPCTGYTLYARSWKSLKYKFMELSKSWRQLKQLLPRRCTGKAVTHCTSEKQHHGQNYLPFLSIVVTTLHLHLSLGTYIKKVLGKGKRWSKLPCLFGSQSPYTHLFFVVVVVVKPTSDKACWRVLLHIGCFQSCFAIPAEGSQIAWPTFEDFFGKMNDV